MAYALSQRVLLNPLLPLFTVTKLYVSSLGAHIQRAPGNGLVNSFCASKSLSRNPHFPDLNSVTSIHAQSVSAEATEEASEGSVKILVETAADQSSTSIEIVAPNWPGILASITDKFKALELQVVNASVDLKDGLVFYKFFIQDLEGNAIVDAKYLEKVEEVLRRVLNPALWSDLGKNVNLSQNIGDPETQRRRRLLWLMDQYLKNDVPSIQKSIVDHVEYTIARSRFKFDDFEAYKVHGFSARVLFLAHGRREIIVRALLIQGNLSRPRLQA
jgi:starch phosphorylase